MIESIVSTTTENPGIQDEQVESLIDFKELLKTITLPRESDLQDVFSMAQGVKQKVEVTEGMIDRRLAYSQNNIVVHPHQIQDLESELKAIFLEYSLGIDIVIHVEPSMNYQASMFTNPVDGAFVLMMSSGVIENFNSKELLFVVGHELAHHYLKHNQNRLLNKKFLSNELNRNMMLYLSLSRAQETSCDRLGLMFCKDLSIAVNTMIKLSSQGQCVRLNVRANDYLNKDYKPSEIRFFDEILDDYKPWALTHPPMEIRIQLLKAFAPLMPKIMDVKPIDITTVKLINKQCNRFLDSLENDDLKQKKEMFGFYKYVLKLQQTIFSGEICNTLASQLVHKRCGEKVDLIDWDVPLDNAYIYFTRYVSQGRRIRILEFILSLVEYDFSDNKKTMPLLDVNKFSRLIGKLKLPNSVHEQLTKQYLHLFKV